MKVMTSTRPVYFQGPKETAVEWLCVVCRVGRQAEYYSVLQNGSSVVQNGSYVHLKVREEDGTQQHVEGNALLTIHGIALGQSTHYRLSHTLYQALPLGPKKIQLLCIKDYKRGYSLPTCTCTAHHCHLTLLARGPVPHLLEALGCSYLGWTGIKRHPRFIHIVYLLQMIHQAMLIKHIFEQLVVILNILVVYCIHAYMSSCISATKSELWLSGQEPSPPPIRDTV